MPTESANPRIYTAWNGQGGVQVTNITTNISIKGNQNRCSNIELILNILNASFLLFQARCCLKNLQYNSFI